MRKIFRKMLGKLNLFTALVIAVLLAGTLGAGTYVWASSTSSFTQAINAGSLATDIVDAAYTTVASPAMAMSAATFSFKCQTVTGSFGTATEQIYVANPNAANGGWALSLAPTSSTDLWNGTSASFDVNDPTSSGCTDGADADSKGGQMTVNPSAGTLAAGLHAGNTTGITKGSSAAFAEGTQTTIAVLTAAAGSDDLGDWTLQGVSISQTIPLEQAVDANYTISMVLTIATI